MSSIEWIALIVFVAAIVIWFVIDRWRYYSRIWRKTSSAYKQAAEQHHKSSEP